MGKLFNDFVTPANNSSGHKDYSCCNNVFMKGIQISLTLLSKRFYGFIIII